MRNNTDFLAFFRKKPDAISKISGGAQNRGIKGTVKLYQTNAGVIVVSDISGLPFGDKECYAPVFAFHIHSGKRCLGNADDEFADAMTHYNPKGCLHPYHAGDMPPLFSCGGRAFSVFLTDRFTVGEIIGRTVIIHSSVDDFTTQPGGGAGSKIACGVIKKGDV